MVGQGFVKVLLLTLLLAGCVANSEKPATSGTVQAGLSTASVTPSLPKEPVDRPAGPYKVTLLADGAELEFLGEVTRESMAALTKAINDNQGLKVVQLTSPGGDLHAANKVADLISARHLTTFVPIQCVSACSTLFLGGTERIVAEGASLGFHSLSMTGAGSGSKLERVANEAMGKDIVSHGVSPDFAAKVTATPHSSMWYPTPEEMLKAHAITGTAPQSDFAQPSVGPDPVALLDWSYLNDPVFWGFKTAYPADYEGLRAKLYDDITKRGFHSGRQSLVLASGFQDAIDRAMGDTSDQALVSYFQSLLNYSTFLNDITPGACLDADKARPDMSRQEADLLESLDNLVTLATISVFDAVPTAQEKPPTRSEYNTAMKSFTQLLVETGVIKAGDKKVFERATGNKVHYCAVYLDMLTAMLRTNSVTRDTLLRGFSLYD